MDWRGWRRRWYGAEVIAVAPPSKNRKLRLLVDGFGLRHAVTVSERSAAVQKEQGAAWRADKNLLLDLTRTTVQIGDRDQFTVERMIKKVEQDGSVFYRVLTGLLSGHGCDAAMALSAALEFGGHGPGSILPLRRQIRCAAALQAPFASPNLP